MMVSHHLRQYVLLKFLQFLLIRKKLTQVGRFLFSYAL